MTKWYVKKLSEVTGVSVQTLHYYDQIDLLKPSSRLENSYRLYSEKDLLKLQQITALKFFGFKLSKIKEFLSTNVNAAELFSIQAMLLESKAQALLEASGTLKKVIPECKSNESIPWETIIELIEVYHMTQQLEKTWAGKVLDSEEMEQYANFVKINLTQDAKQDFKEHWGELANLIQANLEKSPKSDLGIDIATKAMGIINALYGKEHANLRHTIWNKGYKTGGMDSDDNSLSPEMVTWLDVAIDYYYKGRIYSLLDRIGDGDASLCDKWDTLMDEVCGNSKTLKKGIVEKAQTDPRVNKDAREWLLKWKL